MDSVNHIIYSWYWSMWSPVTQQGCFKREARERKLGLWSYFHILSLFTPVGALSYPFTHNLFSAHFPNHTVSIFPLMLFLSCHMHTSWEFLQAQVRSLLVDELTTCSHTGDQVHQNLPGSSSLPDTCGYIGRYKAMAVSYLALLCFCIECMTINGGCRICNKDIGMGVYFFPIGMKMLYLKY